MRDSGATKVLMVVGTLNLGGLEILVADLAKILKRRFSFHILCITARGKLSSQLEEAGIPVTLIEYKRPNIAAFAFKLFKFFKNENFHVVHVHFHITSLWVIIAARLAAVPAVVTHIHNTYFHRGFQAFKVRTYEKVISFLADKEIAVSNAVKDFVIRNYKKKFHKIQVIYNGIDLKNFSGKDTSGIERQEIQIEDGARIIGTVASLTFQKGHEYLLRAMPIILESCPKCRLLLIGKGSLEQTLKQLTKELGLEKKVTFLGVKENISLWLKTIDIFVLPSLWEGLPIALIEAMACVKPIVATNVGGIPEVVEDGKTGILVPPGNSVALANAILSILIDSKKSDQMGQAGKARANKHFSIEKTAFQIERLYAELLKKKC